MFRFSIRELLLVTLVVALALGWCIDHVLLNHKMTGIIRLYESAAKRLNEASNRADKSETPIAAKSR